MPLYIPRQHGTDDSLYKGLVRLSGTERSLCKVMKVKPWLKWKPESIRDGRAVRHLLKRTACQEWNQVKKDLCPKQKSTGLKSCKLFNIRS